MVIDLTYGTYQPWRRSSGISNILGTDWSSRCRLVWYWGVFVVERSAATLKVFAKAEIILRVERYLLFYEAWFVLLVCLVSLLSYFTMDPSRPAFMVVGLRA